MSTFLGWIVAAIFIAWLLAAIHVIGCAVCEWRLRRDARRASRSYWDMRDALREEDVRLKAKEPMMSNWKPIETVAAVGAPPIDIDAAYKRLCRSTLAGDIIAVHRAASEAHAALPQQEKQMREVQARKSFIRALAPPSVSSGYAFDMSPEQWRDFIDEWFRKEYGA